VSIQNIAGEHLLAVKLLEQIAGRDGNRGRRAPSGFFSLRPLLKKSRGLGKFCSERSWCLAPVVWWAIMITESGEFSHRVLYNEIGCPQEGAREVNRGCVRAEGWRRRSLAE